MSDTAKTWIQERRKVQDGASSWGTSGTAASIKSACAQGERAEHYEALLTAVEKVLELHAPETEYGPDYFSGKYPCVECNMSDQEGLHPTLWPCPTVQAIEGTINE